MAASAFTIFARAKENLGEAKINFSTGNFRLILIKSNATALSQGAASTWASMQTAGISGIASGGNYSASGVLLAGRSWISVAAGVMKLDFTDFSLSANGVPHALMRAMLIKQSTSDIPICYASFSATTSLAAGDKLTITFPASGILELS